MSDDTTMLDAAIATELLTKHAMRAKTARDLRDMADRMDRGECVAVIAIGIGPEEHFVVAGGEPQTADEWSSATATLIEQFDDGKIETPS